MSADQEEGDFFLMGGRELYLYALPLHREENVAGAMVMFYETKHIKDRVALIWENNFIRLLVSALFISLTTLLVIRWSMIHPIARMAEWMKSLRTEKQGTPLLPPPGKVLFWPGGDRCPASQSTIREQGANCGARKPSDPGAAGNTCAISCGEGPLPGFNREPYIETGKKIETAVLASGLVTLEPIPQACGGLGIMEAGMRIGSRR
jgi:hypothetical protein